MVFAWFSEAIYEQRAGEEQQLLQEAEGRQQEALLEAAQAAEEARKALEELAPRRFRSDFVTFCRFFIVFFGDFRGFWWFIVGFSLDFLGFPSKA